MDSGQYTLLFLLNGYTASTKTILVANAAGEVADITLTAEEATPVATPAQVVPKPAATIPQPVLKPATEGNKIYGTITDEKDGSPIMGAVLKVKGGNGTQTDMDGKYGPLCLKHTLWRLAIWLSQAKYYGEQISIEKEKKVDIRMTEEVREMDIVVVTGTSTKRS